MLRFVCRNFEVISFSILRHHVKLWRVQYCHARLNMLSTIIGRTVLMRAGSFNSTMGTFNTGRGQWPPSSMWPRPSFCYTLKSIHFVISDDSQYILAMELDKNYLEIWLHPWSWNPYLIADILVDCPEINLNSIPNYLILEAQFELIFVFQIYLINCWFYLAICIKFVQYTIAVLTNVLFKQYINIVFICTALCHHD